MVGSTLAARLQREYLALPPDERLAAWRTWYSRPEDVEDGECCALLARVVYDGRHRLVLLKIIDL